MTRIAVLLTNNDTSAFARGFANDGFKVIDLLEPVRPDWQYEVVSVKDGVLPESPHAFDGYVITGSPASVNDESLPWLAGFLDFIRVLDAARKPLIGLCFGHQAIAKALGGRVERNLEGWGLGCATTQWAAAAGSVSWMKPTQAETLMLAAHNEQVAQMPTQATCLGGNVFCPIASMLIGRHIFTTQYHPEMTPVFMQALLHHLEEKLPANQIGRARESLSIASPIGTLAAKKGPARMPGRALETQVPQSDTHLPDARRFAQWMVQFLAHAR